MMSKDRLTNEDEPREAAPGAPGAETEDTGDDTEGHFLLPDAGASRILAESRARDIEREVRDRQRSKEGRPNDKHRR
jgi:hypothetical protein